MKKPASSGFGAKTYRCLAVVVLLIVLMTSCSMAPTSMAPTSAPGSSSVGPASDSATVTAGTDSQGPRRETVPVDIGALLGIIFGGLAAAAAAVGTWLMVRYRRGDRRAQVHSKAQLLVRECEGARVLWNTLAREEPDLSYGSVLDLRRVVRKARGELPSDAPGVAQLDVMKSALEAFCDRYESQNQHLRNSMSLSLPELIKDLRSAFIPALEEFRELHGVPAGHRATENPWTDPIAFLHIPPPERDRRRQDPDHP